MNQSMIERENVYLARQQNFLLSLNSSGLFSFESFINDLMNLRNHQYPGCLDEIVRRMGILFQRVMPGQDEVLRLLFRGKCHRLDELDDTHVLFTPHAGYANNTIKLESTISPAMLLCIKHVPWLEAYLKMNRVDGEHASPRPAKASPSPDCLDALHHLPDAWL